MSKTFSVEVEYGIKYETPQPAPIAEIIESLQSLEKLLKRTPAFIEQAYGDIKIIETHVRVSKVESGSLVQNFIIEYVFQGKENYEDAKKVYKKMMANGKAFRTIVAMGVGGLITYGAMQIIPTGKPATHIEAYNNTIINVGGTVDFSADDFRAVLESVTDRKSLAKEAVGAIKPAKSQGDSRISITSVGGLDIPVNAVSELPEKYEPLQPQERESHYKNVEIVVYASDRDKMESGWGGIIPGVIEKRVAFVLDESVDPAKLHGRIRFKADIVAHERYVPSKKEYEVKKVEIMAVN